MKVKELCEKLMAQADPDAEVLIYDADGSGMFPVTSWIMNRRYKGPDDLLYPVVELEADDDYLPDDSPWKVGEH